MLLPNVMQGFSLEIVMIVETTFIWFHSRKNRGTPSLKAFYNLVSALMLFLVIDVPVRMLDLELVHWNSLLVFILNVLYISFETLTIYEWYLYFLTVQNAQFIKKRIFRILVDVPILLMIILLVTSYWTHWLFYVDENGLYVRGTKFYLQFLLPYIYLITSCISTFIGYKVSKNKRVLSILLSALLTSIVASILQVLYSGSFTHAGVCVAVLLVYVEMFQEEIKQIDKMKSLSVVNDKLEKTNKKLKETVKELQVSISNEKAASNAKNDFLSRMSHDMRTPLNGILGIIEIDNKHPEDTKLLSENRAKAKTAATHLVSLINDVLDMNKLTLGKYELAHEPFSMNQLIKGVFEIENTRAVENGITLILEKDPVELPLTYGSPIHIERVLYNIIGNAIKYNKPNGSVKIDMQHKLVGDKYIRYIIRISDTGIGMSEEFLYKLFDPFSQERIDARSVYEGTGLGMSITKALVDKMGGTIDVKSIVGEGSTFLIRLVFEIVEEETQIVQEESDEELDLTGFHILLAEDNELNIEIAVELLQEVGALVEVAENGQIACDKFSAAPEGTFDVILMDCMMPVLDGYAATKAIREMKRDDAEAIPIIAMTANAFVEDINKCLEAGMNAHLAKPFEIQKVIKTIRKYVSKTEK